MIAYISSTPTNAEYSVHAKALKAALDLCVMPGECQRVRANRELSYTAKQEFAALLHKLGQRQRNCDMCCKWTFPHEQCQLFKST